MAGYNPKHHNVIDDELRLRPADEAWLLAANQIDSQFRALPPRRGREED